MVQMINGMNCLPGATQPFTAKLLIVFALSMPLIHGCGWVDSAGDGSSSANDTEQIIVFLNGSRMDDVVGINENISLPVSVSRPATSLSIEQTYRWFENPPEQQGGNNACTAINGFNADKAVDNLTDACTREDRCELQFIARDDTENSGFAEFELQVPELQASVGVNYSLSVEDQNGQASTNDYMLCLIAINEAPVANPDTFVVVEGDVLTVTASEPNLLSNDSDDTDVSNTELFVLTEPLQSPQSAAFFRLGNDGGFTYQPGFSGLLQDQFDRFEYQVSDGVHVSSAVATIRVVASNEAPQQVSTLDEVRLTQGEAFELDLASAFQDPEGAQLSFSFDRLTPLPFGTGLVLSDFGLFSGSPTIIDVGRRVFTLQVSDGEQVTEARLTVDVAESDNQPPLFTTGTVSDQSILLGASIVPIRPRFTDPDGDTLSYSIALPQSLPNGLRQNQSTGVISGTPIQAGIYRNLRVQATDPGGESGVSDPFTITVRTIR